MRIQVTGLLVGALILLPGCASGPPEITVASYDFSENRVLAEIYAVVLENEGYPVVRDASYTDRLAAGETLGDGRIRVVPEYLGSLSEELNQILNGPDAAPVATGDPAETAAGLAPLLEQLELVATAPSPAQDQLAFAVRRDTAAVNELTAVSDLGKLNGQLGFGGTEACSRSAQCLPGLEQTYGLQFRETSLVEGGGEGLQNALAAGQVDVVPVFTTDPGVAGRGLQLLADDKALATAQNIVAVFAGGPPEEAVAAINAVNQQLTTDDLWNLAAQVRVEGFPVEFVAANWAESKGLIPAGTVVATPEPNPAPTIVAPPIPEPEPEPEPAPRAASTFDRNRGEPSGAAKSLNWGALAQCESTNRPTVVSSNGLYHGLYQFSAATWRAVGGTGVASEASPEEQLYRAQILYDKAGRGQWPVCGRRL